MLHAETQSSAALKGLQRLLAARKTGASPLFRSYVESFTRQSSLTFLAGLSPESLLAFFQRRFENLQRRGGQPFLIDIEQLQPGHDGEFGPLTLVDIVADDRPFLTDSVQGLLAVESMPLRALFHPILHVRRGAGGKLKSLGGRGNGSGAEVQLVLVVESVPAEKFAGLKRQLKTALHDVIRCVEDFPAMNGQLDGLQAALAEKARARPFFELLRWFRDNNFIFLGFLPFSVAPAAGGSRRKRLQPRKNEGLGLLSPGSAVPAHRRRIFEQAASFLADHAESAPFLAVEETDVPSNVHNRNFISALLFSPDPLAARKQAWVITGLFTHRSQREDVLGIPMVRQKLESLMGDLGLAPKSYSYKEMVDFLNGLPKFELFRLAPSALKQLLAFVLSVTEHPRVAIEIVPNKSWQSLRVLVTIPEAFFPPEKMDAIRRGLEALLGGRARNTFAVRLSSFSVFGLMFRPVPASWMTARQHARLRNEIQQVLQTREAHLLALAAQIGMRGPELLRSLLAALPEDYKVAHEDPEILTDLACLERLATEQRRQLDLRPAGPGDEVKLVLYDWELSSLSRIMPLLTNLRLHVVEEKAFEIPLAGRSAHMQFFQVRSGEEPSIVPADVLARLRPLLFGILDDELENDPLNALLFSCGFGWRQINLMMMLRNYLMQVGTAFTKRTINGTLIRRQAATRALFEVFEARFDPAVSAGVRARRQGAKEAALTDAMQDIDTLTEDRIYKRLLNLIRAGVRTNYYQDLEHPVLAIKFASHEITDLPRPLPLFEIYVHGPLMEGIHLRGGMIARGGIRYSDRPDDFRTEVLGLMDTQMKKNALIVPVGSKGGYVVKSLLPYQGDARGAGDAQYSVFMRALLSVTDNLVRGRVVHPKRVVRHDGDDPYLVVAADKGTAHLSDTANGISMQMGHWLGDAFASGGSNGYDHKGIAITARGAWESVKRHFWEAGRDLEKESIRVVGIGDMSGDVFGNGMLLNRRMKLVGAFNHMHIFLDPDPDPAPAFRERTRLFRRPRSAWSDYDRSKLSKGGGVFLRNTKAIALSPQARRLLQTDRSEMSGEEAVRALLALDVDLIWNGGIGTYFKAADESDVEVGDHGNDAVRITADAVRAKVIGEGGNLGLTQAARIAIDHAGGRLNTDAIDNAGGVHMSDQEVNLKILFGEFLTAGLLRNLEERNTLLRKLEGPVTDAVIHRNYLQANVLAMDRIRSAADVLPFLRVLETLAGQGRLDRRAEGIPNAQLFQRYQSEGLGIPRPILAVLLSGVKMALFEALEKDRLLDEPYVRRFYFDYFPAELRRAYDFGGLRHPLERQIKGTVVTNLVVDQAGIAFVMEASALSGRGWPEVVRAYLMADAVAEAGTVRDRIYALDYKMPADEQYRVLMRLEAFLADFAGSILLQGGAALDFEEIPSLREGLAECRGVLKRAVQGEAQAAAKAEQRRLTRLGLRPALAEQIAWLPHMKGFLAVSRLAATTGISVSEVVALEKALETQLGFDALEQALASAPTAGAWDMQFCEGLLRTINRRRHEILEKVLKKGRAGGKAQARVGAYLERNSGAWAEYQANLSRVLAQGEPELVALGVVVSALEHL